LTPESEDAGRELSARASAATASFRLRGLDEGGLGGKGLLNFPGEGTARLGSEGGSFSLECLCLREGRVLAELGEGAGVAEEASSASLRGFLGSMKCFILGQRRRRTQRAKEMGKGKKKDDGVWK